MLGESSTEEHGKSIVDTGYPDKVDNIIMDQVTVHDLEHTGHGIQEWYSDLQSPDRLLDLYSIAIPFLRRGTCRLWTIL